MNDELTQNPAALFEILAVDEAHIRSLASVTLPHDLHPSQTAAGHKQGVFSPAAAAAGGVGGGPTSGAPIDSSTLPTQFLHPQTAAILSPAWAPDHTDSDGVFVPRFKKDFFPLEMEHPNESYLQIKNQQYTTGCAERRRALFDSRCQTVFDAVGKRIKNSLSNKQGKSSWAEDKAYAGRACASAGKALLQWSAALGERETMTMVDGADAGAKKSGIVLDIFNDRGCVVFDASANDLAFCAVDWVGAGADQALSCPAAALSDEHYLSSAVVTAALKIITARRGGKKTQKNKLLIGLLSHKKFRRRFVQDHAPERFSLEKADGQLLRHDLCWSAPFESENPCAETLISRTLFQLAPAWATQSSQLRVRTDHFLNHLFAAGDAGAELATTAQHNPQLQHFAELRLCTAALYQNTKLLPELVARVANTKKSLQKTHKPGSQKRGAGPAGARSRGVEVSGEVVFTDEEDVLLLDEEEENTNSDEEELRSGWDTNSDSSLSSDEDDSDEDDSDDSDEDDSDSLDEDDSSGSISDLIGGALHSSMEVSDESDLREGIRQSLRQSRGEESDPISDAGHSPISENMPYINEPRTPSPERRARTHRAGGTPGVARLSDADRVSREGGRTPGYDENCSTKEDEGETKNIFGQKNPQLLLPAHPLMLPPHQRIEYCCLLERLVGGSGSEDEGSELSWEEISCGETEKNAADRAFRATFPVLFDTVGRDSETLHLQIMRDLQTALRSENAVRDFLVKQKKFFSNLVLLGGGTTRRRRDHQEEEGAAVLLRKIGTHSLPVRKAKSENDF